MKLCSRCILPEAFPGIRFDNKGVCNFCREFKGVKYLEGKKEEYRKKFLKLINEYKGKNSYDALMCYSGGKDSTYTLIMIKEKFDLNVLAVTMDNGFISPQAVENIHTVVENVNVDHIMFKPRFDTLKKIFRKCAEMNIYPSKTLERASAICTSCMGIVKFSVLRMALEKQIPFIAFGWSLGQAPITSSIMKNNPSMIRVMQKVTFDPLYKIVGDEIRPYFLGDRYFTQEYLFPYNISPLAFLNYDEGMIYQEIEKYGWRAPKDTDANSTNCLLNSFANTVHKEQFGFHPYVFELANLVRNGVLGRQDALERLNRKEEPSLLKSVEGKIYSNKETKL